MLYEDVLDPTAMTPQLFHAYMRLVMPLAEGLRLHRYRGLLQMSDDRFRQEWRIFLCRIRLRGGDLLGADLFLAALRFADYAVHDERIMADCNE